MAWHPLQMKQENLSILRMVLLNQHCATKSQLAKMSGLSVVTVNALLNELLEHGEVLPEEELLSIGGRPAVQYRYNAQYKMALVGYMYVHEGRETLFLEVQDLFQVTLLSYSWELETLCMEDLEKQIAELMQQYPSISVMVFGIPGTADKGKIKVIDYPIFQSNHFFDKLQEQYQIPMLIENDINAALFGYCRSKLCAEECMVGIYLPRKYPPGCAVYIRGDIYRGNNNMVGELNQLPVSMDWNGENLSEQKLLSQMQTLLQIITCMYDPHTLLVYCDFIPQTLLYQMVFEIKKTWKTLTLPQIVFRMHIHEDFSLGIRELAIRELYDLIICKDRREYDDKNGSAHAFKV